jgi:hypothetical protein
MTGHSTDFDFFAAGHGVYRLMNITVKIYDVRRQFGGITEPGAKSVLLSHAHKCNTSLDTMLVSAVTCVSCFNHVYASCSAVCATSFNLAMWCPVSHAQLQ